MGHTPIPESLVFPHTDHNTLIYEQIRLSRSPLLPTPLFHVKFLIICSFPSHLTLNPPSPFALFLSFHSFSTVFLWVFSPFLLQSFLFCFFFVFFCSCSPPCIFFFSHWCGSEDHEAMCRAKRISFIIDKKLGRSMNLNGLPDRMCQWQLYPHIVRVTARAIRPEREAQ